MKFQLKTLASYSADSKPMVLVAFDDVHYLFGCPEGAQRMFNQQHQSLAKVGHVLLSRTTSAEYGGVHGILITIRDMENETAHRRIVCHGPPPLSRCMDYAKVFTRRAFRDTLINSIDRSNTIIQDHNLTVHAYVTTSESVHEGPGSPGKRKRVDQDDAEQVQIIQYVCHGPDMRGKFDPAKAKALGLAPGPLYGKLTQGNSVTKEDGTVIHPDQVLGQGRPGAVWMMLDIPSLSFINAIKNSCGLFNYIQLRGDKRLRYVFHNVGHNVSQHPEFQAFLKEFASETIHIVFDPATSGNPMTFPSLHSFMRPFRKMNPKVFPNLYRPTDKVDYASPNVINAEAGMSITVEPKHEVEYPSTSAKKSSKRKFYPVRSTYDELAVFPLGTGSAMPSLYRNVSSHLITLPNGAFYLFDAGEATLGQLRRLFGIKEANRVVKNLKCITVSHIHADHHFGLYPLIQEWSRLNRSDKLYLLCTEDMWHTVLAYAPDDLMTQRLGWLNAITMREGKGDLLPQDLRKGLELNAIQTVPVNHIPGAHAIIMDHTSCGIVAFSGDGRPSMNFAKLAQDATLLIHESTFEDDKAEMALEKKHCTVQEAMEVATQMQAKNVLLTHFSQRYPGTVVLNDASAQEKMNVVMAFDLMCLPMSMFPVLHQMRQQMDEQLAADKEYGVSESEE